MNLSLSLYQGAPRGGAACTKIMMLDLLFSGAPSGPLANLQLYESHLKLLTRR